MKKLWGKLYKNNRLIKNCTADLIGAVDEDGYYIDIVSAACDALNEICDSFDIENPLWLDNNRQDFTERSKTVFRSGNFIDTPDFDLLEIEVIE